jgi:hypothetical protein
MKSSLAILLLGATTAFGQIDNPPTSTSILDATTVGRAVLTASNAAAARSAIEVTLTNLSSTPTLTALTNTGNSVLGTNSTNTVTVGGNLLVGGSISVTNAATTRTNLGLGALDSVQFSNVYATATTEVRTLFVNDSTNQVRVQFEEPANAKTFVRNLTGSTNTNEPFSGTFNFNDPETQSDFAVTVSNGIILFINEF